MPPSIPDAVGSVEEPFERATAGYADPHEHRPLAGYAALTSAFGAAFVGALVATHRRGHDLPERIETRDIVLMGLATHKLTRLIGKDRVTSFLRAPFTEYQESLGHGEIEEKARGRGLRQATGELIVCPYCLAQWVSGAFAVGTVGAPRLTRLLAAMWTAQAISDAAQLAYHAAEQKA